MKAVDERDVHLEVLDRWFVETARRYLRGKAFLVRFVDDAIIGRAEKSDAEKLLKALAGGLAKYGLERCKK